MINKHRKERVATKQLAVASIVIAGLMALGTGLGVAGTAGQATGGTDAAQDGRLKKISYQVVGLYESQPQESLDNFAIRLWPVLRKFTNQENSEVCGYFAEDQKHQTFEIILGTNGSQIRCLLYPKKIPVGTVNLRVSYHSHVADKVLQLREVDRQIMAITNPREDQQESEWKSTGRWIGLGTVDNTDNQNFSMLDYESGHGFLATSKALKYQQGQGTSQTIAIFQAGPSKQIGADSGL